MIFIFNQIHQNIFILLFFIKLINIFLFKEFFLYIILIFHR